MVENPKASMYVWAKIPEPYAHLGSLEFAKRLLAEAKVCVSPGIGFGDYGDTHVRFALIENQDRIRQAVRGIKAMFRADGLLKPGKAAAPNNLVRPGVRPALFFCPKVFFIISPLCSTTLSFIFGLSV